MDREFVSFVRPSIPIPKESTDICGITNEMVAEASDWSIVAKQFIEFCSGDVILVAHNNDNFDIHFLRAECKRCEVELPDWKYFDTLKWARKYRPDLPRHGLQLLREHFGIPANTAHRALDDVVILHKVASIMIDDLSIDTAWSLLYDATTSNQKIVNMPFGKHQGIALDKVPTNYLKWLKSSGALDKPENAALSKAIEEIISKEPATAE